MPRRPFDRQPSALVVAILAFLLAALLAASLIWHAQMQQLRVARADVADQAEHYAQALTEHISRTLSVTYALAALVRQGQGEIPDFEATARELLQFYPGASALHLAPGGVIRRVVPMAGNEAAVGLDLLQNPAQRVEALAARGAGKLTLAGPFNLIQGGFGAVGRLPVFLDDTHGVPRFWGFTMVMMRLSDALEPAHLSEWREHGFDYYLWRIHPAAGKQQIIAGTALTAKSLPVERMLSLPNASWTLSISPVDGWIDTGQLALEAALGLLFSLLLATLAKLLAESQLQRHSLERQVVLRTREVMAREADLNRAQAIAHVGSWAFDPAQGLLQCSAETRRILDVPEHAPIDAGRLLARIFPGDRARRRRVCRDAREPQRQPRGGAGARRDRRSKGPLHPQSSLSARHARASRDTEHRCDPVRRSPRVDR